MAAGFRATYAATSALVGITTAVNETRCLAHDPFFEQDTRGAAILAAHELHFPHVAAQRLPVQHPAAEEIAGLQQRESGDRIRGMDDERQPVQTDRSAHQRRRVSAVSNPGSGGNRVLAARSISPRATASSPRVLPPPRRSKSTWGCWRVYSAVRSCSTRRMAVAPPMRTVSGAGVATAAPVQAASSRLQAAQEAGSGRLGCLTHAGQPSLTVGARRQPSHMVGGQLGCMHRGTWRRAHPSRDRKGAWQAEVIP